MDNLRALIEAIDVAKIPQAARLTAMRLALRADEMGRVLLEWEQYKALTECAHDDAARRHLRELGAANLITWRGGKSVIVQWTVVRQYATNAQQLSENRQLVSENRQQEPENRQLLRVDNKQNGYRNDGPAQKLSENAQKLPENAQKLSARARWLHPYRAVIVGKRAVGAWKQAAIVGKQAVDVCHLYARTRADCLFVYTSTLLKKRIKQSTNRTAAHAPQLSAYDLLIEVGMAPNAAREMADFGFDKVRRAVAAWWPQRKCVGGKFDDYPGVVIYWLKNPGRVGFPPELPEAWLQTEMGQKYLTDAERANTHTNRYEVPGIHVMPALPTARPAVELPPPLPHDDPWRVCLGELSRELPSGFLPMLENSRLEAAGTVPRPDNGKPVDLYRIVIDPERAAGGLNHFVRQVGTAIRRKLGSVLGKPVLVEIVAAAAEAPTV